MQNLLSGPKRSYYGKGETVVHRLHRDHNVPEGESPLLSAKVTLVIWGDAFWPTYTTGDNTDLVATDSMKNFVQRETLNYEGWSLEGLLFFLGRKFLDKYPQAEGAELYAEEIPVGQSGVTFEPSGGPKNTAHLWLGREDGKLALKELVSGLAGYRLLRLSGSAFYGFVRDEYTTLPETKNRPLRMFLELKWRYSDPEAVLKDGKSSARTIDGIVRQLFGGVESGSIQQVIYQIGTKILASCPEVESVDLEGQNHTWEMVAEAGEHYGVFTDSKPFYGILGVSLKRGENV